MRRSSTAPVAADPPAFVRLAAHPLRWRLLQELVRSDRAVRELTELVGEPQNLVSYHLRRLRDGGLVASRRSSADRRDAYYAIDLARCHEQLRAVGGALHPALGGAPAAPAHVRGRSRRPGRVLFLCTGNSARSQMAEALLTHVSGGTIHAASAGSRPKPLHAEAVRAMAARGIDISGHRAKHVDELRRRRFDLVVTLCDRLREDCPELPSHAERAHWSIPDPAMEDPSYPAFERVAADLETRTTYLSHRLTTPPTRSPAHADR